MSTAKLKAGVRIWVGKADGDCTLRGSWWEWDGHFCFRRLTRSGIYAKGLPMRIDGLEHRLVLRRAWRAENAPSWGVHYFHPNYLCMAEQLIAEGAI